MNLSPATAEKVEINESGSTPSLNLCKSAFHLWRFAIVLLFTTMTNGFCGAAEPEADFYVSPKGDDA